MTKVGDWTFSDDGGERYHGSFDTREEALEEARRTLQTDGEPYEIKLARVGEIPTIEEAFVGAIDIDLIMENAEVYLGDNYATQEPVLDDLPQTDLLERKLAAAVSEWAREVKYLIPWFTVDASSVEDVVL